MENPAVKNGIIGGLLIGLVSLLTYFLGTSYYFSPITTLSYLLIYLACMFLAVTAFKQEIDGGYTDFKTAFKTAFIAFAIASFISMLFTYVLYNIIDPSLLEIDKAIARETLEAQEASIPESWEDWYDATMEGIELQNKGIGTLLMNWSFSLVTGAIGAAIIAAIMKRNAPESV